GPPKRSAPNIPYGPSPSIGRTFVAGSTRPGGSRATSFWSLAMAGAIWSAATHAATGGSAGLSITTPHGATRSPWLARLDSSSSEITDLRLVRPVTTASGKLVTAAVVGLGSMLGSALGSEEAAGLGGSVPVGTPDREGVGLSHAARATTKAMARARSLRRARAAPNGGAEPPGTSAMVVPAPRAG